MTNLDAFIWLVIIVSCGIVVLTVLNVALKHTAIKQSSRRDIVVLSGCGLFVLFMAAIFVNF